MDNETNLKNLESEARRLRAKYADVPLIRTVIALDLAIRRAAFRVLDAQASRSEGSSMSRSTPGSSTS